MFNVNRVPCHSAEVSGGSIHAQGSLILETSGPFLEDQSRTHTPRSKRPHQRDRAPKASSSSDNRQKNPGQQCKC